MLRRSQSRTLIASAVLLACLALTGQTRAQNRAQMSRTGSAAPLAGPGKSGFSQGIIARAQRILIASAARGQHSLLKLQAATLSAAFIDHTAAPASVAFPLAQPGLHANDPWRRTSRAYAS